MTKLTRLYRVESPDGEGAYQATETLGTRICIHEKRDIDLYYRGTRTKVEYTTHSGDRKVHVYNPIADTEFVYHNHHEPSPQLALDFGAPLKKPRDMWEIAAEAYNGIRDISQVDLVGLCMKNMTKGFDIECMPYNGVGEQLGLDVTLPVTIVGHEITRGRDFSVAGLLELQHKGTTNGLFAGDPNGNRPGGNEDDIKGGFTPGDDLFAFASLERMSAWFDGLKPADILDIGGRIRVMDVRNARVGKCQAVFTRRDIVKEFTIVRSGMHI